MGTRLIHQEKIMTEATTIQMPDLIDTDGPDNSSSTEIFFNLQSNQNTSEAKTSSDGNKESSTDIFSGMTFDKSGADEVTVPANGRSEPFDIFGLNSNIPQHKEKHSHNVHDLKAGLSVNEKTSTQQTRAFAGAQAETLFSDSTVNPSYQNANSVYNGVLGPQSTGLNPSPMFPLGPMPYNMPPGLMFNSAFPAQPLNYGAMGNLLVQQQFAGTMSNFQQMGSMHSQNTSVSHAGAIGG